MQPGRQRDDAFPRLCGLVAHRSIAKPCELQLGRSHSFPEINREERRRQRCAIFFIPLLSHYLLFKVIAAWAGNRLTHTAVCVHLCRRSVNGKKIISNSFWVNPTDTLLRCKYSVLNPRLKNSPQHARFKSTQLKHMGWEPRSRKEFTRRNVTTSENLIHFCQADDDVPLQQKFTANRYLWARWFLDINVHRIHKFMSNMQATFFHRIFFYAHKII